MNYFMLQSSNGRYLARAGTNYYLTTSIEHALKDKPVKLSNIQNSIPKNLQIYKPFKLISYNTESKKISQLKYQKENIVEIKKHISDLQLDLQSVISQENEFKSNLQDIDQELSDIMHYIEFHRFSASEGYKLCKRIQELRDIRRDLKNKIEMVNILKTGNCQKIADGDILESLNRVDHKIYCPRKLTTLFIHGKNRERENVEINY